ncbi:hypothetical protein GCM10023156_14340 [Novipirellula rosea]|uniref:Uncharacterized protein n=1 Tax=Novipirellula rosea TaxID=1031540 RepID=A0ABP8MHK2_9BACT
MRVQYDRDHGARNAVGHFPGLANQRRVASMDSVEIPDADHAAANRISHFGKRENFRHVSESVKKGRRRVEQCAGQGRAVTLGRTAIGHYA